MYPPDWLAALVAHTRDRVKGLQDDAPGTPGRAKETRLIGFQNLQRAGCPHADNGTLRQLSARFRMRRIEYGSFDLGNSDHELLTRSQRSSHHRSAQL